MRCDGALVRRSLAAARGDARRRGCHRADRSLGLLLTLVLPVPSARAELAPGATLGPENAAAADELLSPEVLAHYKAGEYKNAIAAWPAGAPWETRFAAASAKNAERLDVNERGTIVEKGDGQARGRASTDCPSASIRRTRRRA